LRCAPPAPVGRWPDPVPHGDEVDAARLQNAGGDPATLPGQGQQQVLGADVVAVQALGLLLGELEHPARALGEGVQAVRHGLVQLTVTQHVRTVPRDWRAGRRLRAREVKQQGLEAARQCRGAAAERLGLRERIDLLQRALAANQ
jgi:hypothetical protein